MKWILAGLMSLMIPISTAKADDKILSAIEIGAKRINAVAYRIGATRNKETHLPTKIYDRTINAALIAGAADGHLLDNRIGESTRAVATLLAELRKLDPDFFVLVASSAFESIKNRAALEASVMDATGQAIRFVTSDDEVYYGLVAGVPRNQSNTSIFIDVGSGNTKLGYLTPLDAARMESVAVRYGTVSLKDAATKDGRYSRDLMTAMLADELRGVLSPAIEHKPGLANASRRIYVAGGAAWATTTLTHPEDSDKPYVSLTFGQIKDLNMRLLEGSFRPPVTQSARAARDIAEVQNVFSGDDLQSGTTILTMILHELRAEKRKIAFTREGGWVLGYMLSIYYSEECRGRLKFDPPCRARIEPK